MLLVAHVYLPSFPRCSLRTHTRQRSDDLIEDLERHLAGAITEYLQVRVTCRHSGFPQRHVQTGSSVRIVPFNSITDVDTICQSTATAAINRQNMASPWSPHPQSGLNLLFNVVASH